MFTDLDEIGAMFDRMSVFDRWQKFEHRSYMQTDRDLAWVRGLYAGAERLNGPRRKGNRAHYDNWLERQKADPEAIKALKEYKRDWMRRKRDSDSAYCEKERKRQRDYDTERRQLRKQNLERLSA